MLTLKALGKNPSQLLVVAAVFGVPWLVAAALQSLPLSLHGLLSSLHVFVSPNPLLLKKTPVIGFRAHPNPVRPHLNLVTSTKTLFPHTVTLTDGRGQDLNTSYGGCKSIYHSIQVTVTEHRLWSRADFGSKPGRATGLFYFFSTAKWEKKPVLRAS